MPNPAPLDSVEYQKMISGQEYVRLLSDSDIAILL